MNKADKEVAEQMAREIYESAKVHYATLMGGTAEREAIVVLPKFNKDSVY